MGEGGQAGVCFGSALRGAFDWPGLFEEGGSLDCLLGGGGGRGCTLLALAPMG